MCVLDCTCSMYSEQHLQERTLLCFCGYAITSNGPPKMLSLWFTCMTLCQSIVLIEDKIAESLESWTINPWLVSSTRVCIKKYHCTSDSNMGSVILLWHNAKVLALLKVLTLFVQCWWPRESMLHDSSTLSKFCTSLSKVLTLWHYVKVKQH